VATRNKPVDRPINPNFSSGPCAKRPGWSSAVLDGAALGRSHRSEIGKKKLKTVIDKSREILGVPDSYLLGIVPASDTGAVEMALWSLLGCRGVDLLVWESFGAGWADDVETQLKLEDCRVIKSDYGELPDLSEVDFNHDVVFPWNGTTSGVCIPDGNWIKSERKGLTICDATSAAFAMELPWDKLDVVTYSWQKVLGSEAQHGVLVISPRAIERLEKYTPPWPLPKIFRLTKDKKLNYKLFRGETINTPSMLVVEDVLDSLEWAERIGGLNGLIKRSMTNLNVISDWLQDNNDFEFLVKNPLWRSSTSVCVKIVAKWFKELDSEKQLDVAIKLSSLLEEMDIAYDIGSYRDAPPGLRIWAGSTVDPINLKLLFPWLEWGLYQVKSEYNN